MHIAIDKWIAGWLGEAAQIVKQRGVRDERGSLEDGHRRVLTRQNLSNERQGELPISSSEAKDRLCSDMLVFVGRSS